MIARPRFDSPATGVVVTGGASGIGRASAEALAAVGRGVAIWDIDRDGAERVAAEIVAAYGVAAVGVGIDLSRLDGIDDGIAVSRAAIGPVGGLVHAAGVVDTGSIDGLSEADWERGIGVHLRALAFLTKALLPDLAASESAAIVAVASINATLGNAMNPVYSAAKGGILSLVRSLADRLARDGIRINSVSPGMVVTPMMQPAIDATPDGWFERRILLERLGRPDEIGRVVRFLMSDEASYITASEIVVDGGNISSQR